MISNKARLMRIQEFLDQIGESEMLTEELEAAIKFGNNDLLGKMFKIPPGVVLFGQRWLVRNISRRLGINGIGLAEEANGQPVTTYYFEEAVDLFFDEFEKPLSCSKLRRFIRENRNRVLKVVVTQEGRETLLQSLDWDQMRRDLLCPELFQGIKIGSGSEGDVYEYKINGQTFVVKLFSEEKQRKVNEFASMWRTHFPEPDFTDRVGFTKKVVEEAQDWPKRHCKFSSLVEYGASQNYFITELGPLLTVRHLVCAAGLQENQQDSISKAGETFVHNNSISRDKIQALKEELERLYLLGGFLRYCRVGFLGKSGKKHDFCPHNLLVRGFDKTTGCFDLVLIDQGQDPLGSTMDPWFLEQEELAQAQKTYDQLAAIPEFRAYFDHRGMARPMAQS